jgi:hypothetical protein
MAESVKAFLERGGYVQKVDYNDFQEIVGQACRGKGQWPRKRFPFEAGEAPRFRAGVRSPINDRATP